MIQKLIVLFYLSAFLPTNLDSQNYGIWQYESLDSMNYQGMVLELKSTKLEKDTAGMLMLPEVFNLCLWTLYKIDCYQDSIISNKLVMEMNDGNIFFVDPADEELMGLRQSLPDTSFVERKIPTAEGLLQFKLAHFLKAIN